MSDVNRIAHDLAGQAAFDVLMSISPCVDVAAKVHAHVMEALSDAGFECFAEFPQSYKRLNGKTAKGRIDVACRMQTAKGMGWVAIEIDARKPRQNSVRKLSKFNGYKIVALRGVQGSYLHDRVDAVIGLPVFTENPCNPVNRKRRV